MGNIKSIQDISFIAKNVVSILNTDFKKIDDLEEMISKMKFDKEIGDPYCPSRWVEFHNLHFNIGDGGK